MNSILRLLTLATLLLSSIQTYAAVVHGSIKDASSQEPLIGATIQVSNSTSGTITDFDGLYSIAVDAGVSTLVFKYLGYQSVEKTITLSDTDIELNIALEPESELLDEVAVVAHKNRANHQVLALERRNSSFAIENIGARELSLKGIGNVSEGVKKLTGISIAHSGNVVVRGLGDRYSITTLNGIPIASPNPDNKLIPLMLFPSSTIQNITVSKVYNAATFADYSGAHIDIGTTNHIVGSLLSVGVSIGGKCNTLGQERYAMDNDMNLFHPSGIDSKAFTLPLAEFDSYAKSHNVFSTSYQVRSKPSLPDMSGNISLGKNFQFDNSNLTLLAALNAGYEQQNLPNSYFLTLESTGNVLDAFGYDSYNEEQQLTALAHAGYAFGNQQQLGYTLFFSKQYSNSYQKREGTDAEGHHLLGSNNTTHIYTLQTHQLAGEHRCKRWTLAWCGSYGTTSSHEPDRRQVMFVKNSNGELNLFKLNRQETMRYFGELNEQEWNGTASAQWNWSEESFLKFGYDFKDKHRNYTGTRFYYNLNRISPTIDNIFDTDAYLNYENIACGNIVVERKMQPKDSYRAENRIHAGYLLADIHFPCQLLLNIGLRYEYSQQWVEYATDGGERYAKRRDLNTHDLFPALNLKYNFLHDHCLRLSASRTVTRPSFIEMAPFLYQESYGSAQLRGNADLNNGYNYNIDLRYEFIREQGDMASITGYFKYLDSPIERIQALQGGATLHSFKNAQNGIAGGVEVELRKNIVQGLAIGANASYMYTNVKLPEGGAYTNKERALQGASPILLNADITYSPTLKNGHKLNLALLYNLQGSRIHAVGIAGLGDVKQRPQHTLNFNFAYTFAHNLTLKLQVNDMLNSSTVFVQEVPHTGQTLEVERYQKGTNLEIGISYRL